MKLRFFTIALAYILLTTISANASQRIFSSMALRQSAYQSNETREQIWFGAAINGNLAIIQEYLKSGFPVDTQDYNQRTALHFAASQGHITCVQELINAKADISLQDTYSSDPMRYLCLHGNCNAGYFTGILYIFLAAGFNINSADSLGNTCLHFAANREKNDYVIALLNAGANVNSKNFYGQTPLAALVRKIGNEDENTLIILIKRGGTL